MECPLFTCQPCGDAKTFYTLGDLDTHRFIHHELPLDEAASLTRLAFEHNRIGRPAPTTPPVQSAVAWSRTWMKEQIGKEGA